MQPHILFLNRTAHTLGGAATWLDYLDSGLRDCGWRVTLGLLEGKHFHRPERYRAKHPHRDCVRIACRTGTRSGRREALSQAIRSVAPDLVITLNVADAVAVVGEWRRLGQATPWIAVSAQMIDEGLFRDIAIFSDVLDGVICTNALTKQLAIELGGMPPERVWYGPYGVPIRELEQPVPAGDCLRLFYVGRIDEPDKRVHDLVAILDELEARSIPFQLTVIGSGPDEPAFRQRLRARIEQGAVRLLGRLPPDEIWPLVHAAAGVLLLTSWTDTGPLGVLEAMSWNVPVVSSRYYGSGREGALRHGETAMLFPIGDAPAAAGCLQQLWADPALRRGLMANAAEMVRHRYSRERSITAWNRVFRDILDTPMRSGVPKRWRPSTPELPQPAGPASENDEWPLTLAGSSSNNADFWAYVAELDAG